MDAPEEAEVDPEIDEEAFASHGEDQAASLESIGGIFMMRGYFLLPHPAVVLSFDPSAKGVGREGLGESHDKTDLLSGVVVSGQTVTGVDIQVARIITMPDDLSSPRRFLDRDGSFRA